MEYSSRARRASEVYSIRDFKFERSYETTPVNARILDSVDEIKNSRIQLSTVSATSLNSESSMEYSSRSRRATEAYLIRDFKFEISYLPYSSECKNSRFRRNLSQK